MKRLLDKAGTAVGMIASYGALIGLLAGYAGRMAAVRLRRR